MSMQLRRNRTPRIIYLLVLCLFVTCQPVDVLSAQNVESGSTTVESDAKKGIDVPADSDQDEQNPEEKKEETRPRELGVMVLILWLLAGTGIGILVFTSLFGHSVRSMIRRPYPPQTTHSEQQPQSETPSKSSPASEQIDDEPNKS